MTKPPGEMVQYREQILFQMVPKGVKSSGCFRFVAGEGGQQIPNVVGYRKRRPGWLPMEAGADCTETDEKICGGIAPPSIHCVCRTIESDPAKPLISRAKDELFLPGSTGKLITASAALEEGVDPVRDQWPNPRVLDLPQTTNTLENFGGSLCNGGSPRH